jgi:hypothetical protein
MRFSDAFVGLNLAELFPSSGVRNKNLGIFIADYNARRDDARTARRKAAVPDSYYAKLLAEFDELLAELTRLRDTTLTDPLSIQVKKAKKLANKLHKCINRLDRVEDETPFGDKATNLIFAITSIVIREIESLAASQPMSAYGYLTGESKHYWLTTKTQSLTSGLHRNNLPFEIINASAAEKRENKTFQNKVSGFRGKGGFYDQLEKAGFVLDKVVDGTKVRLKINLEWIFGWSINVLQDPSVMAEMAAPQDAEICTQYVEPFFSGISRDSITGLSQFNKFKETEYNESGVATLREVEPTEVGKGCEESEEKETAAPENPSTGREIFAENEEKNAAAPEIAAQEDEKTALEVATDSAIRVMKLIFNVNNLKNNKIRYNGTSIVSEITKQDALDMRYWMLNTMRAIKREGENWTDVGTIVNEAVENTAKYLQDHPTRWIYHPKFYLDPKFSVGTLKCYVEAFLHPRPISDEQPREATPTNPFTPQIQWLIEAGANREKVKGFVRKFGEDAVSSAIALCGIRMKDGFEPTNGAVAYIIGTINNMDARTIVSQATLAKDKYLSKIAQKEMEKSDAWTMKKVQTIVRNLVKNSDGLQRCTPSVCTQIAERANAQKAVKDQVEIWVSGVAKGTSRLFQA